MVSSQPNISIKNATMGYKKSGCDIAVLQNLNLEFFPGDLVGIVGLNGIGKSTLLKTIIGLLPLISGSIFIKGVLIKDVPIQDLAKEISIVLTEKVGGFNLKTFDVVASGQMPYTDTFNHLNADHYTIIDAAIKRCGLSNYSSQLVNELSDGLFQKTMIAKALAQQTPIMLLDEPSAFLDYASKHDLFLLLKELCDEQKKCILVSTHDLDLLLKYSTKLLVISDDKIELILTAEAHQNASFKRIGGGFI
jgi:iron complex transport system ATP-binding protein